MVETYTDCSIGIDAANGTMQSEAKIVHPITVVSNEGTDHRRQGELRV